MERDGHGGGSRGVRVIHGLEVDVGFGAVRTAATPQDLTYPDSLPEPHLDVAASQVADRDHLPTPF